MAIQPISTTKKLMRKAQLPPKAATLSATRSPKVEFCGSSASRSATRLSWRARLSITDCSSELTSPRSRSISSRT